MSEPTLCDHRLGRAHHGRRVTRHTMRSIARARPECKETP